MPDNRIKIQRALMLWITTVGYMGLLFFLSSQEQFRFTLPPDSDKIVHACAYMPLGFLLYRSLSASGVKKYLLVAASLLALLYGVSDEIHQFFVPGRYASYGDVIADTVGGIIGSIMGNFSKKLSVVVITSLD